MTDAEFLREVKRYVLEVDPNAEVWLFGSRARGDFHSESDEVMQKAKTLIAAKSWNGAMNRLYYSAFHALSASKLTQKQKRWLSFIL